MVDLRVQEVAKLKGLDIAKLSRAATLSYPHASNIWHNRVDNIELATLCKIADALNVPVSDLIGPRRSQA
jgi:transcriptional regulator with XRE-family HTH domain